MTSRLDQFFRFRWVVEEIGGVGTQLTFSWIQEVVGVLRYVGNRPRNYFYASSREGGSVCLQVGDRVPVHGAPKGNADSRVLPGSRHRILLAKGFPVRVDHTHAATDHDCFRCILAQFESITGRGRITNRVLADELSVAVGVFRNDWIVPAIDERLAAPILIKPPELLGN